MRRLEFENTQGINLQYELAVGGERFLAWLIDAFVIGISITVLIWFLDQVNLDSNLVNVFLVFVPIFFFYTLLMEILNDGQSLGKMALGVKVVRVDGQPATPYDYLMRWMFRWVDIYMCSGAFAILTISATPRAQRLGDLLADTTVIRIRNGRVPITWIDRLDKLAEHNLTFPQVTELQEEQIVVARATLHRFMKSPNPGNRKAFLEIVTALSEVLQIKPPKEKSRVKFVRTVIKDYIAISR